jgi:hypothetical protein
MGTREVRRQGELTMQTYIFTVAVTGDDVQDIAAELRERVIGTVSPAADPYDAHVTEAVRVTP